MPSAEIITIGTEILLGEIRDTNTAFIARVLKDNGIDLFRTHTIGDNLIRISQTIRDSLQRADVIITTGGLGPTVDDPTREAVSSALDRPLEFHPELWKIICQYFKKINRDPSENNRNQAYLPAGARAIPNPVGTAPGIFSSIQNRHIFCLPGVPREMENMLTDFVIPTIHKLFPERQVIRTRVLHVSGMGESQVDALISDLERLPNPTIGLAAHPGQIDIRIGAKAFSDHDADQMIADVEERIRYLLGANIYGSDNDTLITSIRKVFPPQTNLGLVEYGFDGALTSLFEKNSLFKQILHHNNPIKLNSMELILRDKQLEWSSLGVVGISLEILSGITRLVFGILYEGQYNSYERKFAGPPQNGWTWATQISLDLIRRFFLQQIEDK